MYPNLYYFFKDVFGVGLPVFKLINSFGFFLALSFFAAVWLLRKELRRKQAQGYFIATGRTIIVGEKASLQNILPSFLWGCIVGYKLLGLMLSKEGLNSPQQYLLSPSGNIPAGLLCGIAFAGWKWFEINKHKLPEPQQKIITLWPADRVADMAVIAAVTGIIGAKIFDNLEHWGDFIKHPVDNLFSVRGLTFYGGLITATFALWYYARKKKIGFINLCDAAAPALMFAYCVGRMGCQVAGDGDWGIINSAYLSFPDGKLGASTPGTLDTAFAMYGNIYMDENDSLVPRKPVKAFAGLPDWLFASSYLHNVNKAGVHAVRCTFDDYCNYLPIPVFPTPLYEVMMAFVLFAVLWALRKKMKIPGRLFAVYLVFNGIERLLIEQIRVNTKYSIFGFHPTQAEIISSLLIIGGILLYWNAPKIKPVANKV
ncbi:MAG TPA: prolipoprotein diacylglyceryl transferase family protein [Chitinophagaceae bacterium]|nr:prolipoprotein diacylglyceryl transferase family protein [Chitinophagaceae bacterium]